MIPWTTRYTATAGCNTTDFAALIEEKSEKTVIGTHQTISREFLPPPPPFKGWVKDGKFRLYKYPRSFFTFQSGAFDSAVKGTFGPGRTPGTTEVKLRVGIWGWMANARMILYLIVALMVFTVLWFVPWPMAFPRYTLYLPFALPGLVYLVGILRYWTRRDAFKRLVVKELQLEDLRLG